MIVLFVIVAYPQLLCLLVSATCGLLFIGGFVALPKLRIDKTVSFLRTPPEENEEILSLSETQTVWPVLNGRPVRLDQSRLWFDISVRLKNVPLLLASTLVVPASIALTASHANGVFKLMDNESVKYSGIMGLGYCSVFFLAFAGKWIRERLLLRRSRVAVGVLQSSGQSARNVRYSFTDPEGHYHGQMLQDHRPHKEDNILFVLYDPAHPDNNQPFWSFWFHSIEATVAVP